MSVQEILVKTGWLVGWLDGSRLYVPLPVGQMKGR